MHFLGMDLEILAFTLLVLLVESIVGIYFDVSNNLAKINPIY